MPGRLHDAVSLCHLATANVLPIGQSLCQQTTAPYWSEAVASEIDRGVKAGDLACVAIKAAGWLGTPIVPSPADRRPIQKLRLGLQNFGDPPWKHSGEAESLHLARKLRGEFVTDDEAAYDQAQKILGVRKVLDTVDLFRLAVSASLMTSVDAAAAAARIRAAGRHLRPVHPQMLLPSYFE